MTGQEFELLDAAEAAALAELAAGWKRAVRAALARRPGVLYVSDLEPVVTPFGVMLRDPLGMLLALGDER